MLPRILENLSKKKTAINDDSVDALTSLVHQKLEDTTVTSPFNQQELIQLITICGQILDKYQNERASPNVENTIALLNKIGHIYLGNFDDKSGNGSSFLQLFPRLTACITTDNKISPNPDALTNLLAFEHVFDVSLIDLLPTESDQSTEIKQENYQLKVEAAWTTTVKHLSSQIHLPSVFHQLQDARIYSPNMVEFLTNQASAFLRRSDRFLSILEYILDIWLHYAKTSASSLAVGSVKKLYHSNANHLFLICCMFACNGKDHELSSLKDSMNVTQCEWSSIQLRRTAQSCLVLLAKLRYILSKASSSNVLLIDSFPNLKYLIRALIRTELPTTLSLFREKRMKAGKSGKEWKQQLAPRYILHYMITHLEHPDLSKTFHESIPSSEVIGQLIPLILMLVNDHQEFNKVIGLKLLLHLIRICVPSQLKPFGPIVLETLYKCFAFRLADVVKYLLPCLIEATLSLYPPRTSSTAQFDLDKSTNEQRYENKGENKSHEHKLKQNMVTSEEARTIELYDDGLKTFQIFRLDLSQRIEKSQPLSHSLSTSATAPISIKRSPLILINSDAESEQTKLFETILSELEYLALSPSFETIETMRIYTSQLPRLIALLGLSITRTLHRVLPVIFLFLNGGDIIVITNALHTLGVLIHTCWPRMVKHTGKVIESLVQLYIVNKLAIDDQKKRFEKQRRQSSNNSEHQYTARGGNADESVDENNQKSIVNDDILASSLNYEYTYQNSGLNHHQRLEAQEKALLLVGQLILLLEKISVVHSTSSKAQFQSLLSGLQKASKSVPQIQQLLELLGKSK